MRKRPILIFTSLTVLLAGLLLLVYFGWEKKLSPVERGRHLAGTFGCQGCHTPTVPGPSALPVPDSTRLMSGHPEGVPYPTRPLAEVRDRYDLRPAGPVLTVWPGPWGVSFAANLTPDKETGIGGWTEEMFIRTIRTGKHEGRPTGREILPPMPWRNFSHPTIGLPDSALKDIWAYLRALPPVRNQVPQPLPPEKVS
jgi:hypothetical protein